jgi:hypothetical protein
VWWAGVADSCPCRSDYLATLFAVPVKMMRNSGSPVQYLGIYVALCAVTCVLALYGAMEHANLKAAEAAADGAYSLELKLH